MSNEFTRRGAEAEPIDSREIHKRADVMAAGKVGLIGPSPPEFDHDQAVAKHTVELFMMSALIYRTTKLAETTDEAIGFIKSDDFLCGAIGQDLLESGHASAGDIPGVVNGLREYIDGRSYLFESVLDDPEELKGFKRTYFAACKLANEQGLPFEDVFMDKELSATLYYRLESDAIFEQL